MIDDDAMVTRAHRAYFRSGGSMQPNQHTSGVEEHDGKTYAVLRSGQEILAVYRIKETSEGERLARLKRWPKELEVA